jgi:hypothetical protein
MNTQLQLGTVRIAKNLNCYRMAIPTEAFWAEWKANKEGMRAEGVSVFKRGGSFYVAIYDGTSATQEAYDKQEQEAFAFVRSYVLSEVMAYDGLEEDSDYAYDVISAAATYEDISRASAVFEGIERLIAEAQDALFNSLLQ